MMQIVQELCKRPGLNKCGFDMPTIYIPNANKVRWSLWFGFTHVVGFIYVILYFCLPFCPQPSRCVNQIDEVCRTIEKTINQTVQNTLNSLEKDCELINDAVTDTLINDRCVTETLLSAFSTDMLDGFGTITSHVATVKLDNALMTHILLDQESAAFCE